MDVTEYGLFVKSNQDVDPVYVRVNLSVGSSYSIIAVLAFDVRVIFNVREDIEPASIACFCKSFSN